MLIHGTNTVAAIWKQYKTLPWNSLPRIPFPAQLPGDLRMTPIRRTEPCSCYTRGVHPRERRTSLWPVAALSRVQLGHNQ